jgi:arabinose-5-phosphate isomerase
MKLSTSLSSYFDKQSSLIEHFFNNVDIHKAEQILDKIMICKGMVIFTGVGKSGFVARKLAATLISIGIKSLYLSSQDALHGDLGIVGEDDLLIALSKSGATKEIMQLVQPLKKRNSFLISWVSTENSPLEEASDLSIVLPVIEELCPFNLAPTTSPSVQLLFGDILCAALIEAKQFSLDDYALNHPAGSIGSKLTYLVDELMKKEDDLPICSLKDQLKDVITLLSNKRLGCLLVVSDNQELVGIFTDGDLRRNIQLHSEDVFSMKMEELMTDTFLHTVSGVLAYDAMKIMQQDPSKRVMMLPVLEGKTLKGLICMHDIIHAGI